jgi:hypothetical protein
MTIYAARLTSFGLIFIRFRVARTGHGLLRMTDKTQKARGPRLLLLL